MNSRFFNDVYEIVRMIPYGRVTSYGAIAKYLGTAKSSRMVGFVLNGSHNQHPFVPAHRVVNRLGILSGKRFFGGPNTMKELLESEGVKIKEDKVVEFDRLFWDPAINL